MDATIAELRHASRTHTGQVRQGNEDAHGEVVTPDGGVLLVVCDGLGGHEAGEVASALAIQEIQRVVVSDESSDPRARLYDGFLAASDAIALAARQPGRDGMATTGVAALVKGRQVWVANVGDSRLYHFRGGDIVFRTKDHTRVQRMVDLGLLSEEEAKHHPHGNIISRALGHPITSDGVPLEPDVLMHPLELEPGDALLLCSDGLYDLVEDHEILPVIAGLVPDEAAQRLVDLANERGGHDNITVTVALYGADRFPAHHATPVRSSHGASGATSSGAGAGPVDGRPSPALLALVALLIAGPMAWLLLRPAASTSPADAGETATAAVAEATPSPTPEALVATSALDAEDGGLDGHAEDAGQEQASNDAGER